MKSIHMKRWVTAALAVTIIGGFAFSQEAAAASKGMLCGMPNPITTYDTYGEAASVAHFRPLYLPMATGYDCHSVSLIDKTVADLRFVKRSDQQVSLRVRTAQKSANLGTDISGVYSVTWQDKLIDGHSVSLATIKQNSYVAHWQQGTYLFSAEGENMSYTEFIDILRDGLVDMSEHYY
jgi:hypothetical protein